MPITSAHVKICPVSLISEADVKDVENVINAGARLYKGVVPAKALRDPFVDQNYIKNEINLGVNFLLLRLGGEAVAVCVNLNRTMPFRDKIFLSA